MAIFTHPDDETMLAGGTLAALVAEGAEVHYLCATRGEGGELGEPHVCTRQQLAQVRSRELQCAVSTLGGASLSFLDYVDPLVGQDGRLFAFQADINVLVHQVSQCILSFDVVITHGSNGEYGHPGHLLVHQAVLEAVQSFANTGPALYTVQADFTGHPKPRLANKDDFADLVLEIQPFLLQKIQAAYCHRSQHALFVRRGSQDAGRKLTIDEVVVKLESLRVVLGGKEENLYAEFEHIFRKAGVLRLAASSS